MKNIIIGISIVLIDIAIFIILGLLLMDYEDFYDESKGEYWSLESMTNNQKIIYILFNIWEAINVIFVIYLGFRLIKKWKNVNKKP